MIEYNIWATRDPHSIAMNWGMKHDKIRPNKAAERAWAIGARLGIDDVTRSLQCLGCHSTVVPEGTPKQGFEPLAEGVTCIACHGPYRQWVIEHTVPEDPAWRGLSRDQKWTEFGMVDLSDPVTLARLCISCHLGDPDPKSGKMITHAMYAAGHPPLSSIEVAAFNDLQPRHWQYLREKTPELRKRLGSHENRMEQTELVAVGGIVVLRDSMRLFSAQARATGYDGPAKTNWPDFARFDCFASHQELRFANRRSTRGDASPCPPMPTWPTVLVPLCLTVAYPDMSRRTLRMAEFDLKLKALIATLQSRPYGDREQSAIAALALANWSDSVVRDLLERTADSKSPAVDGRMALSLLNLLCEISRERTLDFDSAGQIFSAFVVIYGESNAVNPKSIQDPDIPKILNTLEKRLRPNLSSARSQRPNDQRLDERLRAIADYNPRLFRAYFAELAKRLPGVK
jgi:hypothetical protein